MVSSCLVEHGIEEHGLEVHIRLVNRNSLEFQLHRAVLDGDAFKHLFDEGYLEVEPGKQNAVVFTEDRCNANSALLHRYKRGNRTTRKSSPKRTYKKMLSIV